MSSKLTIASLLLLLLLLLLALPLLILLNWQLKLFPRFLLLIRHPRMAPTHFHLPPGVRGELLFPVPERPLRCFDRKTRNLDSRYEFLRPLGLGCEGCANLYLDWEHGGRRVVIKEFFGGVRQNPLPSHLLPYFRGLEWWPAEIPATLYFANGDAPGEFSRGSDERRRDGGFVYALDYFWVKDGGWRLVTPFHKCGTLETLAELVRKRGLSPSEVDAVYRRRFRGVVEALAKMHERGFSHDDVKMDNIFVADTGAFLLGDLGNVREHAHCFHSHTPDVHTGLADYSQGDTERAIRSYMGFLRGACADPTVFDREFRAKEEEWARFYWRYKSEKYTARELLQDSFFMEAAGLSEEKCSAFEKELDAMRAQLVRWKKGDAEKPLWEQAAENRSQMEPVLWKDRIESKEVDRELACISPSCLEKVWPWKRKLSHSSY